MSERSQSREDYCVLRIVTSLWLAILPCAIPLWGFCRQVEQVQPVDWARFPVGARLRILPNHACATAAQHAAYHVVNGSREILARWERFGGW